MIAFFKKFGWVIILVVVLIFVLAAIMAVVKNAQNLNNDITTGQQIQKEKVEELQKAKEDEVQKAKVEETGNNENFEGLKSPIVEKTSTSNLINPLSKDEAGISKNIQSENEIERSSEIDALTKSEISELTSSGIIESDQQMKLSTAVNTELKTANSSNSDSVTEQTSLDMNKLESKRLLQSNLDDEIIVEDQNDDPSVEVDIMRVDDTGEALVAGRTQPNTMVEILVDNEVIADTKANEDGEFVVMGNLESSSISQTLTVRSKEKGNESETISETVSKPEGPSILNKESDKPDWKLSQDIFIILPVSNKNSSKLGSNLTEAPIIVQSSSSDIKIIQNKDISSIKEIIIDSISYSDLGEAVLVGRANPSNKILVYLNNVLKSSSEVGASGGWSTELTGLEPGIYELRLDEVDASGVVKSRIMTPFKKESKDFLMNMVSGSITVQTGNSLWRIARRIFGRGIRYIEIFEKNADLIKDPNLIYPGQVFSIPTKN